MVMVPLLTGNALQHPELFVEHLQQLLVMMVFLLGIYFLFHDRLQRTRATL
jgi:hypothetical protein